MSKNNSVILFLGQKEGLKKKLTEILVFCMRKSISKCIKLRGGKTIRNSFLLLNHPNTQASCMYNACNNPVHSCNKPLTLIQHPCNTPGLDYWLGESPLRTCMMEGPFIQPPYGLHRFPRQVSRFTCHMSHVTCHMSHVTCHMSRADLEETNSTNSMKFNFLKDFPLNLSIFPSNLDHCTSKLKKKTLKISSSELVNFTKHANTF